MHKIYQLISLFRMSFNSNSNCLLQYGLSSYGTNYKSGKTCFIFHVAYLIILGNCHKNNHSDL